LLYPQKPFSAFPSALFTCRTSQFNVTFGQANIAKAFRSTFFELLSILL